MFGAIIGDIIGSAFEFCNYKGKDFDLFDEFRSFTDDSVMTVAICKALMESDTFDSLSKKTIENMQEFGIKYPNAGYGNMFRSWIKSENPTPYNSFGNGSAMRVSGVAYVAKSIEEVKKLSNIVTSVTHNHPEGIKGAEAVSVAIYLSRQGATKDEIKDYIEKNYYSLDFNIDDIRETYYFSETCQGSVPQAIKCFLESKDFEDAIRIAISLGGDSDTIGAIAGSIAEAYYGVPSYIKESAITYLDENLYDVLKKFELFYLNNLSIKG